MNSVKLLFFGTDLCFVIYLDFYKTKNKNHTDFLIFLKEDFVKINLLRLW